ncbi:membrane protein [Ligilactobacillus salitolerans]|uniref:Membrane protein n=1 Tax=Ligilactobacillus salitolerans TaxID=1808352 RepID=A0A401ITK1_9LACO|nr:YpmS family protein [Ligilactobacillus salitolerans]GBG94870.1 membrane protein [Ligilactobacillus salitolerans]
MVRRTQKTQVKPKQVKNPWKLAFTILLALVIATLAFILFQVYTPNQAVQKKTATVANTPTTEINVKMDKKQLGSVVNYYLNHQQKESNNIKYKFILDKSAILIGTTKVLGEKISFTLYAQPTLNQDGNIVLKIKSVAIGSLNAPKKFVLNYVKNNFKTGQLVQITPSKSKITLNLNKLQTKQGIRLKGQQLDLARNDIRFKIMIPLNEEDTK